MSQLTEPGRRLLTDLAQRYGLSFEAVEAMALAVSRGGGTMAQFNIPELGGNGQWMAGGMTMVGDMFDHSLKARVDSLCGELAGQMAQGAVFSRQQTLAGAAWWPESLGTPASVGGQNATRYAYFPQARRVAFDPGQGAALILLDSGDHAIGGWSQQQSGPGDPFVGITFSSQHGQFPLAALRRVDDVAAAETPPPAGAPTIAEPVAPPEPAPPAPAEAIRPEPVSLPDPPPVAHQVAQPTSAPAQAAAPAAAAPQGSADDILRTIERMAALRDAGALTDDEFTAKKGELLQRL